MISHSKQWEFLKNKFEANQLAHAYVFLGQEGIGKKEFAKELVKFINRNVIARSDLAIEKETYPDLLMVRSAESDSSLKNEKDMMEIDISQIRAVNHFLSFKSYYGGYKAVIVENADRMNQEAQSCFLKTLEEPKGKTVILLISSKPGALLPTIFSRCQSVAFFPSEKYKASTQEQEALQELLGIMPAELAVKFQYAKKVNVDGDRFSAILKSLQRYFRDALLSSIGVESGGAMARQRYDIF